MEETNEEREFAKLYSLTLKSGAVVDLAADAVEFTNGVMIFYQLVGDDQVEPMRGINTDEVFAFEVRDYEPEAEEHADPAPTLMDSAWGLDPAEFTTAGNPYVDKREDAGPVPDPFRGRMRFKGDGDG